jgi:hypothetical protein
VRVVGIQGSSVRTSSLPFETARPRVDAMISCTRQRLAEFEGTVLHELRIEPSVRAETMSSKKMPYIWRMAAPMCGVDIDDDGSFCAH